MAQERKNRHPVCFPFPSPRVQEAPEALVWACFENRSQSPRCQLQRPLGRDEGVCATIWHGITGDQEQPEVATCVSDLPLELEGANAVRSPSSELLIQKTQKEMKRGPQEACAPWIPASSEAGMLTPGQQKCHMGEVSLH